MTTWILMTVAAVLVQLIVSECFDWLPWLSRKVLHIAALHLPPEHRSRYEDEWLAELEAIPGLRLSRLVFSVRVLTSATATRRAISPDVGLYFSTPAKRLVDFLAAGVALALLMPVFLAIGLVIKLTSAGPVFSKETRLGFEEAPFDFIRFRTTGPSPVGSIGLLARPEAPLPHRVTVVGRFLRRYSLDELPQFINVVKGDMSLVGPRPLLAEEAKYLKDWHKARHAVRPGVSGPWQAHRWQRGLSFDDMVRLDLRYTQGWSVHRDIEIVIGTVQAMLFSQAF